MCNSRQAEGARMEATATRLTNTFVSQSTEIASCTSVVSKYVFQTDLSAKRKRPREAQWTPALGLNFFF